MKKFKNPLAKLFSSKPSIESEIREMAYQEYPDNVDTQNYIYKEQLNAYKFLQKVEDPAIKDIAVKNYPSNYLMQRHTYNQQISAKKYLQSAENDAAKTEAQRQYPKDYVAQKYIYDGLN